MTTVPDSDAGRFLRSFPQWLTKNPAPSPRMLGWPEQQAMCAWLAFSV
jgi:hypothetical protein